MMKIKRNKRGNFIMARIGIPNFGQLLARTNLLFFVSVCLLFLLLFLWFISNNPGTVNLKVDYKKQIITLKMGPENGYYKISNILNDELVKSKKGDYFIINIKTADKKSIIFFDPGKYIIDDFDRKFSDIMSG